MRTSQPPAAGTNAGSATGLGRTALGTATGQRLPVPPRERKPALAALAVLLILGGALTSGYLVIVSGNRVSAIQISRPVAAGQPITLDAMKEVQVGDTGVGYFIRWSERMKVAKAYAAVPLVPGALLSNGMTMESNDLDQGRLTVGLALKPGQFPGEIAVGQRVGLYAVGGQSGAANGVKPGTILSNDALIKSIARSGRDSLRADQTIVSVSVPADQVAQVAQAASAGSIAIALIPPGGTAPAAPAKSERRPAETGGQSTTPAPAGGGATGAPNAPGGAGGPAGAGTTTPAGGG